MTILYKGQEIKQDESGYYIINSYGKREQVPLISGTIGSWNVPSVRYYGGTALVRDHLSKPESMYVFEYKQRHEKCRHCGSKWRESKFNPGTCGQCGAPE